MTHVWFNALLKGILEGVTEFLPISSTGHLILVRDVLPLGDAEDPAARKAFEDAFDIVIQFPAILAIVVLYWRRLWDEARGVVARSEARRFWAGLIVAFLPAGIVGLSAGHWIEDHLFRPSVIAGALFVGGCVILAVECWMTAYGGVTADKVPLRTSLGIGLFQCLGMIPGTSRSAASIIGGRALGLDRKSAAEYSFFLALPTMGAACGYKFLKVYRHIPWHSDAIPLVIGSVASFVTAYLVVAWFIRYLQTRTLSLFGWYRIALAAVVLGSRLL